MYHIVLKYNI